MLALDGGGGGVFAMKFAETVCAMFMLTTQLACVPLHPAPDQPVNVEPVAAFAASVILVPLV